MAEKSTANKNTQTKATPQNSWGEALQRLNNIIGAYSNLPQSAFYNAFSRAMANFAPVQHSRTLGINPLPCDYTKDDLGVFLRNPIGSENALQQVGAGLRWSAYPFNKLVLTYATIPTFKNYIMPKYLDKDTVNSDGFKREWRLVEKFRKALDIPAFGRKVTAQAMTYGKVFYALRTEIDKSHNSVKYAFWQQLPQKYCLIEGFNSVSGYTVAFDLTYFLQIGTDYTQFGELFLPFLNDFDAWTKDKTKIKNKDFKYASYNGVKEVAKVNAYQSDGDNSWKQTGQWCYWVSLPIDKVWTFDIDNSTAITASPLSGLFQTYAQQADYEAAQLSLILNPLIKIFTGEIPYNDRDNATIEDSYKLSVGGLNYFIALFDNLMRANQTAGAGMYAAPFQNIKSHSFEEAAGANDINQKFSVYAGSKSGTNGIIPIMERPTEKSVELSAKLEAQYAKNIYNTLEKVVNYVLRYEFSLNYDWEFSVFGDIYSDEVTRSECLKQIDKGNITAYIRLCALDDESLLDKVTEAEVVKSCGFLDLLSVPPTSFTQSGKSQPKSDTGGAPSKDQTQVEQTRIEKQVEVTEE